MPKQEREISPMEEGLLRAMQAIDKQVAQELQRPTANADIHGVQKWEPYQKRIEFFSSFLLQSMEEGSIKLDSIFVMAQALAKSLSLALDDAGSAGLDKSRAEYAAASLAAIEKDCFRAGRALRSEEEYS